MPTPWAADESGLRLALRVTPNASKDAITGVEDRPGIGAQLRVRVRAVPDQGRANHAVLKLLAAALDIPASNLTLVSGHAARDKVVHIAGEAPVLAARLAVLAGAGQSKGRP